MRHAAAAAVVVAAALVVALYAWTAGTQTDLRGPLHGRYVPDDAYNLLTRSLQDGRLDLGVRAPAGLLALRDPYDDRANQAFRDGGLHDLILYRQKIYSSWGPAPAVVLYLPARLLGIDRIGPPTAVLIFALVGFAFASALVLVLARRLAPRAPPWALGLAVLTVGTGSLMPYVLARAFDYEVAISAAFAFLAIGLFFFCLELVGERPRVRGCAVASVAFGLAFASRPTAGAAVIALAAGAWLVWRRPELGRRCVAALLVPFAVLAALQLAYNAARFGSPLQFGQPFVLAEPTQRFHDYNAPRFVAPGLWSYLVAPPRFSMEFPFILLPPPPGYPLPRPHDYVFQPVTGMLTMQPIVLLALALAVPVLRGVRTRQRVVLLAIAATGAIVVGWLSLLFWFAYQRYEADFALLLLVPALVVWLMAAAHGARRIRVLARTLGTALVGFGVLATVAASIVRPESMLLGRRPATAAKLADFFAPIPTAVAAVRGTPLITAVNDDPGGARPRWARLSLAGSDFYVTTSGGTRLTVIAGSDGVRGLRATLRPDQRGWPRGTVARLVVAAGGRSEVARVTGRRVTIPMLLRRGRNAVDLSLVRDPAPVPGDASYGVALRVQDTRIVGG